MTKPINLHWRRHRPTGRRRGVEVDLFVMYALCMSMRSCLFCIKINYDNDNDRLTRSTANADSLPPECALVLMVVGTQVCFVSITGNICNTTWGETICTI